MGTSGGAARTANSVMMDAEASAPNQTSKEAVRVLLVHRSNASFVLQDAALIRTTDARFSVSRFRWMGKRSLPGLVRAVRGADVVLAWFALDHAAVAGWLARRFGKPFVLVAGGVGVARLPKYRYGRFTESSWKQGVSRYALRVADRVLAVSDATAGDVAKRAPSARVETVYNGVDTDRFTDPGRPRGPLVVTVGQVAMSHVGLKGLDTFARAGALVRQQRKGTRFVIVGPCEQEAKMQLASLCPGLEFTGRLPHQELRALFGKASVYCQLSAHESFGMALAEAMASGCVPVVTQAGALPEVVGAMAKPVPVGDAEAAADEILSALDAGDAVRAKVRGHVIERFSADERGVRLVGALDDVLGERAARR